MPSVEPKDLKPGQKVEIENEPFSVVSVNFVKPGKGQAFSRIRLKQVINERVLDRNFKSGDRIELANVEETALRFLYASSEGYCFMNDDTFEQIIVDKKIIGETVSWIKNDTLYTILFYNNQPVQITPPTFMDFLVKYTEAGARGDTSSGKVMKQATLENDVVIEVPIFIDIGESIRVDTRTGKYASRAGK